MQESPFKRHEPLYLKYRPQSLSQLVGQEGVFRTLVNAIENDRLSHAYLFTGPRGTGKTSSARILAKSLNCKTAGRPTVEPCQTCSCCVEITQGNSPAVFEIDAASNNSVDDARVLIERAPLVAVGGDFKVYIIDECHMLTKEAFNALLKTIEQPPPNVVFILATTEEHKVLPTIISRCQRLMFKLINQDDLGKHLRSVADKEGIEIEDEALQLIARRSGGGLRDALSNLDQASLLAAPGSPATVGDLLRLLGALHEDVLLGLSRQIAERDGHAVLSSVNSFLDEGREPQVVLQELSRHFLGLMKASYLAGKGGKVNSADLAATVLGSESYLNGLLGQVSLFERSELSQIVEQIDRLEQTCRRSSQPAMHLEIGLLGICHRHDIHLLKDLLDRVQRLEEQISSGAVNLGSTSRAMPAQRPAAAASAAGVAHSAPAQSHSAPAQTQSAPAAHSNSGSARSSSAVQGHSVAAEMHEPGEAQGINSIALAPPQKNDSFAQESNNGARLQAAEPSADTVKPRTAPAQNTSSSSSATSETDDADDPRMAAFNSDIEYFWQQVLDELQRRHLPTFSLASTHAFPLSVTAKEVTIGVMKEGFQKMLESKTEQLRTACQAVTGVDTVGVRIRVAEATAVAATKATNVEKRPQSSAQSGADNREAPEARAMHNPAPARDTSSAPTSRSASANVSRSGSSQAETQEPASPEGQSAVNTGEPGSDSSMLKEAYKLFEGPGSRRIN